MNRKEFDEPLIARVPLTEVVEIQRCLQAIDEATFHRAVEAVRFESMIREARFAAEAPLQKLIADDPGAVAANHRLLELQKIRFKEPHQGLSFRSNTGGLFPISSFDLTPGVHVFSPPYDLDRQNVEGVSTTSAADKNAGTFSAAINSNWDVDGYRAAGAALSIVLQTSQPGTISVRPRILCDYTWTVLGWNLSCHTEGNLFVTVTRDSDGKVLQSRQVKIWSMSTKSDYHQFSTSEALYPSDLALDFLAEPSVRYIVTYTVVVSGDQSGQILWNASVSTGVFAGSMQFVVVDFRN